MEPTIRKPIQPQEESVPVAPKDRTVSKIETGVEVPFQDYSREHGHPYSVDYFKLGDNWEVFDAEVKSIEGYIKNRIQSGELPNTSKAVEHELKSIEKLHNLKDEERAVVKVGVIASYIKFLNESKEIKRYGSY